MILTDTIQTTNKLRKRLFKSFNKIEKSYIQYKNNPYIPTNILELRVNMRKIRALLHFLKPIMKNKDYKRLNGIFRNFSNRLGTIRDIDVLLEDFNEIAINKPELISNYTDVFRFLEKKRMELIKKESTKKAFKTFEQDLEEAEEALENLEFQLEDKNTRHLRQEIRKRLKDMAEKLEIDYRRIDINDYENVHDVRKDAKNVSYAIAGLKDWLPKTERRKIKKRAKKIQVELGEHTDAFVNKERLESYLERAEKETLIGAFTTLLELNE